MEFDENLEYKHVGNYSASQAVRLVFAVYERDVGGTCTVTNVFRVPVTLTLEECKTFVLEQSSHLIDAVFVGILGPWMYSYPQFIMDYAQRDAGQIVARGGHWQYNGRHWQKWN